VARPKSSHVPSLKPSRQDRHCAAVFAKREDLHIGWFQLVDKHVIFLSGANANEFFFRSPETDLDQAESNRTQAHADLESSADALRALGLKDPEAVAKNLVQSTAEVPVIAPVGGEIVEQVGADIEGQAGVG
jgi:hypothetical protein